ncbi:prosaposin [Halictus rubicundus]|uniref:prosaposin n=1 Tax=Halictus rubicundus TaxID=77578 RepID=UPI00403604C1
MKLLIPFCAILAVSTARIVIDANGPINDQVLGREKCTWGPSYWCENIKTAAGCNATSHCIRIKWNNMKVPEDNDDVCQVCKDMVQQARDQLESNQTQSDLKAVFEGSCKLIRIKPIVKECITVVDQFIPELIETLASQMNPSVVCSVAGLCNSAHIDQLLEEYNQPTSKIVDVRSHSLEKDEIEPDDCTKCLTVAAHMEYKLNNSPRDRVLQNALRLCGELSTFTDACSATILTYFDTLFSHLQENFNSQNICHLSGQCNAQFHKHENSDANPKVEIRPLSSVGMVDVSDDLPCKLCEQLVQHLRDLLVANTTELEFHQVLDGLCKQTKSFETECTTIVDEYYPEIYEYLTKSLNSNAVCQMSGMCPAPGRTVQNEPIWPLLPRNVEEIGVRIFQNSNKNVEPEKSEPLSKSEIEGMQLGIERMFPFPLSDGPVVNGKASCALCEYIMHDIQNYLTSPATEEEVIRLLQNVCTHFPSGIGGECRNFVQTYGDAVVALLIQEIDPAHVCGMLRLCPTKSFMKLWESIPAKYTLAEKRNRPSCPLCLLAMTQIYNVIKNNRTQANIEAELDKLCNHLPQSLSQECTDLVQGYSKELVELLLADLTPIEVCTFIKLCKAPKNSHHKNIFVTDKNGEILTNEIPDAVQSDSEEVKQSVTCNVCRLAVYYVENKVGSEKSRNKIENALQEACNHIPNFVSKECALFVNKHGDSVINALTNNVSPKAICTVVDACNVRAADFELEVNNETPNDISTNVNDLEESKSRSAIESQGFVCETCKVAIQHIVKIIGSDKSKNKIENAVRSVCKHVPNSISKDCKHFVDKHGHAVIDALLKSIKPNLVCSYVTACGQSAAQKVVLKVNNETPNAVSDNSDQLQENEEKNIGAQRSILSHACKLAVDYVEKKVGVDRTRPKIENALREACGHLPHFVRGECTKLVNEHGDALINALEHNVAPSLVCSVARVPAKSAADVQFQVNGETSNAVSDNSDQLQENEEKNVGAQRSILSHVCKLAVNYVEDKVGVDRTRPKIENALREACGHLPHFVRGECTKLVNEHGDALIDALEHNVAPSLVCSVARVPAKSAADVQFQVNGETSNAVSDNSDQLQENEEKNVGAQRSILSHVCKLAVNYVEDKVGVDRTRPKIENALREACGHLPHFVRGECTKLVNEHGDALINALEHNVAPSLVCSVARVPAKSAADVQFQVNGETSNAVSDNSDQLQENEEKNVGAQRSILSHVCKLAVNYVEDKVGVDRTRPKIENALREACGHLPHFVRGECTKLVNEHGDALINALEHNVAPSLVCSVARVPAKSAADVQFQVNGETSNAVSDNSDQLQENAEKNVGAQRSILSHVCKLAVNYVEDKVGVDRTRPKIENALREACGHLPHFVRGECTKLVNEHGDALINALEHNVAPSLVCSVARVPAKSAADVQFQVNGETSNAVSDNSDQLQENEEKNVGAQRSILSHVCKLAVNYVEDKVGVDRTRPKIENALREACGHLPHFVRGECTKLVNEHGDALINALEHNVAPSLVCSVARVPAKSAADVQFQVNGETSNAVSDNSDQLQENEEKNVGAQRSILSHVCKLAVNYVEDKVGVDRTRPKIENALREACGHLPHFVRGECTKLVNEHGDALINALEHNVAPSLVCSVARVPAKSAADVQFQVNGETSNAVSDNSDQLQENEEKNVGAQRSILSHVCKLAVNYVEDKVGVDRTRPKIENALREACGHLPHFVRGECTKLVNEHGDALIDALEHNVAPSLVCSVARVPAKRAADVQFQVNGETSNAVSDNSDQLQENAEKNVGAQRSILSHVCKLAVNYVEDKVGVDRTRPKIENALREACGHLPHFVRGECTKLVNEHGDALINALEHNVAPSLVCSVARVPAKSAADVQFQVNGETSNAVSDNSDQLQENEEKNVGAQRSILSHVCKLAVNYVEDKVGVDRTRPKIENALREACGHLPHFVRGECTKLVNEHGDALINALEHNVAPSLVCSVARVPAKSAADVQFQVNGETSNAVSDNSDQLQENEEKNVGAQRSILSHVCKLAVNYVEDKVGVDRTRPKIENALREACGHLPHFVRGECTKLVNEHGDALIDALEHNVAPSLVCSVARVPAKRAADVQFQVNGETSNAVSDNSDQLQENEEKNVGAQRSILSHACKLAVNYVEDKVGLDRTRPKIENALREACGHLPHVVRGECTKLVNEHGDALIDALEHNVAPSLVCSVARVPAKSAADVQFQVNGETSNAVSDNSDQLQENAEKNVGAQRSILSHVCKLAVNYVEDKVGVDRTRPKIENALREACGHLPHFVRGECTKLVNEHGDALINALEHNVAPSLVCSVARVPAKSAADVQFQVNGETSNAVSDNSDQLQENEEKNVGAQRSILSHVCKLAVNYVEDKVGVDRTRPKIENALREACGHLPHFVRGECTKLVNEHGDALINALEHNVAPSLVCSVARVPAKSAADVQFQVNGETSNAVSDNSDQLQENEEKNVGAQRSILSHVCKLAVNYVEDKVGVDRTRPKIENALREACGHLPHFVRGECTKLVNEHGDALINALEHNVAPSLVCSVARVPAKSAADVQFQVNGETSNAVSDNSDQLQENEEKNVGAQRSILSHVCKLAVNYVEDKVGVDRTRPKIENALREACGHLPHFVRGECTKLVNEHGDALIDALEHNVAPSLVCSVARVPAKRAADVQFQVNGETSNAVSDNSDQLQENEEKNVGAQRSILSHACKLAVNYVEDKVGVDRTRPKIENALREACGHLPHVVRGECTKLVNEHGDALIDALEHNVAPSLVCSVARVPAKRAADVQFQVNGETSNAVSVNSGGIY